MGQHLVDFTQFDVVALAIMAIFAASSAHAAAPTEPQRGAALVAGEQAQTTTEQIELDWIRQDVVRTLPESVSGAEIPAITTAQYAAGACVGIKDG